MNPFIKAIQQQGFAENTEGSLLIDIDSMMRANLWAAYNDFLVYFFDNAKKWGLVAHIKRTDEHEAMAYWSIKKRKTRRL